MTTRDRGRARPAVWAGALLLVGSAGVATPAWATTGHGQNRPGQAQGNDHGQGRGDDTSSSHGQPSGDDSPPSPDPQPTPPAGSGGAGSGAQAHGGDGHSEQGGPPAARTGGQDSPSLPPSAGSPSTGGHPASEGPPGNNGHIQIDEFAPDGGNGNDPHVTCGLTVSFFGFDGGTQTASITVTPWAPTGGGSPYQTTYQLQNRTRTSGDQFDGSDSIPWSALAPSFSGTAPAHQGYHARVEVAVPYSNGADTKTHMVWIQPCSTTTPGAPPTGSPSGPAAGHTAVNGPTQAGVVARLCTEMASVDVSALPGELGTYFEAVESVLCSPQATTTPGGGTAVVPPAGAATPAVGAESAQSSSHESTSESEESQSGSSQRSPSQAAPAVPGHSQQSTTEESTSVSEEWESAPSTAGGSGVGPAAPGHSQQTPRPGVAGVAVPAAGGQSAATSSVAAPSVAALSIAAPSIAAPSVAAKSLVGGIALAQTAGVSPAVEASNLVAAASSPAPAVVAAAPAPKATAAGSSLPFTGADVALETAAGAALLGGGFALRRLVRRRRRA